MGARPTRASARALVCASAALAALSLSGGPAAAAPGGGGAGGGGGHHQPDECVMLREYERVHPHMSRKAVHKLFETSGIRTSLTQSGSRVDEVRTYDVCKSPDSTVTVSYTKHGRQPFRVTSKTAVFVD